MQSSQSFLRPAYQRTTSGVLFCISTRKHSRGRPAVPQAARQAPTAAEGSSSTHHSTNRHTPRPCSQNQVVTAAVSEAQAILQLGQLNQPSALKHGWQHDIQQSCHTAWQELHELTLQQLSTPSAEGTSASSSNADEWQPQPLWAEQFLLKLDSLLGILQQVLLICGFLKDHHAHQEWQSAATAVFVEARTLEQDICSDTPLQHGLLLAQQQLLQQQQQQQRAHNNSSRHSQPSPSQAAATAALNPMPNLLLLAKALKKHMQLEGLNPQGFAGLATSQNPRSKAQVLSMQEQRAILSGLQAEHRVLLNRMQELLLNPATAPVVQMDADSRAILLHGCSDSPDQDFFVSSIVNNDPAAAAAAAGDSDHDQRSHNLPLTAAATADDQLVDVVLDLQLVQQILQQHPDAHVRGDAYSVGVLQQLDKLLVTWKDLAEIGRKMASIQGYSCYSDLILQHSLLGSHAAAVEACKQIAAALQAAALQAAALQAAALAAAEKLLQQHHLQQQHQHSSGSAAAVADGTQIQGSDLAYLLHQERLELMSTTDLQQLQPYLQFETVMTGFSNLLQLSLSLLLKPRPARDGEIWNDRVLVYELYDTLDNDLWPPQQQQQQQKQKCVSRQAGASDTAAAAAATGGSSRRLLGTVYIDPSGGFSAQLVSYGSQYCGTASFHPHHKQQQQQQQQTDPEGSSGTDSSQSTHTYSRNSNLEAAPSTSAVPCAVALGLQSHGVVGATHSQLALGLWELCHELGHAVNFILSATLSESHAQQDLNQPVAAQQPQTTAGPTATATVGRLHHMHAAWMPIEVLELPSTLFEGFCMDPVCLQVLCQHCETGEKLPDDLAEKLAAFMRHSHYHPLSYQRMVLAMLFDLEMTAITGRQLGRHAAHAVWQEVMTADGLTASSEVEVSLQQVSTLPRLLVSSGQGYGYAVAWCLAQLLWPSLWQLVRLSLDTADSTCGSTHLIHEGSAGVTSRSTVDGAAAVAGRALWRRLFSSGVEVSDPYTLVQMIVQLQQIEVTTAVVAEGGGHHCFDAVEVAAASSWAAVFGADKAYHVAQALQDRGLWPLGHSDWQPEDLLVVCLSCAVEKLRSTAERNKDRLCCGKYM